MENIFFGEITYSMLVSFTFGVACLLLYAATRKEAKNPYMVMNVLNIIFHIVASFLVLYLLQEINAVLIDNYFPTLKGGSTYNLTLSALIGMFGSVLVAMILEVGKKKFGVKNESNEL